MNISNETVELAIIILNWNCVENTRMVVESLSDGPWHNIVVDNASTDSSEPEIIGAAYPQVTVLRNSENLGYAGGMNAGMRWAEYQGYTHALLLNPDTHPTISLVEAMLKQADGAAVVGTAQVTQDMTPYVSAALLQNGKPVPFMCTNSCGEGHDIDIASGAGLLLNLSVAKQLDFMDEQFFHYKEEYDYAFRVRQAGYKIRYNCMPPLIHKRGGSLPGESPTAIYYSFRNEILFLRKHFGRFGWLYGLGIFRNGLVASLKSPSIARSVASGLVHGIRGVSGKRAMAQPGVGT